jgi:hypothetical protein
MNKSLKPLESPHRLASPHRRGFLLVTGSAVAWSLGSLFTRLIPLDSWTMVAWRGLVVAVENEAFHWRFGNDPRMRAVDEIVAQGEMQQQNRQNGCAAKDVDPSASRV